MSEVLKRLNASPDSRTADAYDVYERTANIYRRSKAAMGREPKIRVTMAVGTNVTLKYDSAEPEATLSHIR